jgi:hypothetical protein
VRPATGKTANYVASKPGGELVYGDYVLRMGVGLNQTPGVFLLYTQTEHIDIVLRVPIVYNANTGVIVWKSGPFNDWGSNTIIYLMHIIGFKLLAYIIHKLCFSIL